MVASPSTTDGTAIVLRLSAKEIDPGEDGFSECFTNLCIADYFGLTSLMKELDKEYTLKFRKMYLSMLIKNRDNFQKFFEQKWLISTAHLSSLENSEFYKFLYTRNVIPNLTDYFYSKLPGCTVS